MAEHKIINLADPVNPQDMATKAYVDSVMAPKPADIPIIAWAFDPSPDEATMRSQYQGLLNLGINAFLSQRHLSHAPYDFRVTTAYYDLVFNVAAEMHLKVYWYTGIHRLQYVNTATGQHFLERYKNHPATGGWEWGDEPNYMGWEHAGCKAAHDLMNSQDPNHPNFAVFGYDLSVNYSSMYTYGCELFDVGCECIYPTALWGTVEDPCCDRNGKYNWSSSPVNPFAYWIHYGMNMPNNDGFEDCGKGNIPVIQAHVEAANGLMPCLVNQLDRWQYFYPGDLMKGIGLYHYYTFMGAGTDKANIRTQIKDLARALGWGG